MHQPSTERVRLDPIPLNPPKGVRILPSDGGIEMDLRGPWLLVWTLFFVLLGLVVVLAAGMRASLPVIAFWATLTTLLFVMLLVYGDRGTSLVRVWRFGHGRISREMRLPLPASGWPREFVDVQEFEIVHELFTQGLLSRSLQGGHQDTLRFLVAARPGPVNVMMRALRYSNATLRGDLFTQDRAGEIEREILPDVLSVAFLAASAVGVPLYVIEKTYYVVSDSDG
jgi:hypothetical protein